MPPTYANGHISATGDPIHFMFGAIYDSNKSKMAANSMLEKFQVAISPQPVVRSTSFFVLWWGFRGRRIERRYFWFEQIQDGGGDGGRRHLGKISNGHISATGRISPQRLTIYLYCAHRAVIFAIAQLSCYQ